MLGSFVRNLGYIVIYVLGLIIGGGTNALNKKGEIDYFSEPVPTTHIHFYNFNTNQWISSTDNTSTVGCFIYKLLIISCLILFIIQS